jgi:hypothetical protein
MSCILIYSCGFHRIPVHFTGIPVHSSGILWIPVYSSGFLQIPTGISGGMKSTEYIIEYAKKNNWHFFIHWTWNNGSFPLGVNF